MAVSGQRCRLDMLAYARSGDGPMVATLVSFRLFPIS